MLALNQTINTIFADLEEDKTVLDFRILIKIEAVLEVYIKTNVPQKYENYTVWGSRVFVYALPPEVIEDDYRYSYIFENYQKVHTGLVWRLDFDNIERVKKADKPCNIISFYSYKGGMGRTTTLYTYAIHLALNKGKKVVIIDCDLEAPGYLNMFDFAAKNKNGFVEYVLDKEFDRENTKIENYVFDKSEIGEKFCGKGEIYVMPAGNLEYDKEKITTQLGENFETDLGNYVQGLARLNISRTDEMLQHFKDLFADLKEKYKLAEDDFILIDSRTGFNDIFGLTSLAFSDTVVGFFGSSEQTKPGLYFFLDTIEKFNNKLKNDVIKLVLVNSIVPNQITAENTFSVAFNSILQDYQDSNNDNNFTVLDYQNKSFTVTKLVRNPILEKIGISRATNENKEEQFNQLIRLVKEEIYLTEFSKETTEKLTQQLSFIQENLKLEIVKDILIKEFEHLKENFNNQYYTKYSHLRNIFDAIWSLPIQEVAIPQDAKTIILDTLTQELSKIRSYAENFDNKADAYTHFYYRKNMEMLSDRSRFLFCGFKGTGKTTLYNLLGDNDEKAKAIRTNLKLERNYIFVTVLDAPNKQGGFDSLIKTVPYKSSNKLEHSFTELYKQRNLTNFWRAFYWSVVIIQLTEDKRFSTFNSLLSDYIVRLKNITDNIERENIFENLIADRTNIQLIEQDLLQLNQFLDAHNLSLVVLFDQLDRQINKKDWGIGIKPLIEYWLYTYNRKEYNRIIPKIFIRTDVWETVTLNNKVGLEEGNMVRLDWLPNEIFAYFINLVFENPNAQTALKSLISQRYGNTFLYSFEQSIVENNGQIPAKKELIEPILNIFFGEYIVSFRKTDIGEWQDLGTAFTYLQKNFSAAGENIMLLRPFIWFITGITKKLKEWQPSADRKSLIYKEKEINAIFHSDIILDTEIRTGVLTKHFEDLMSDDDLGNPHPLAEIKDFIRDTHLFKGVEMEKKDLVFLLNASINEISSLVTYNAETLIDLLKINGIIYEKQGSKVGKYYRFAEMFKYYFKLKSIDRNKLSDIPLGTIVDCRIIKIEQLRLFVEVVKYDINTQIHILQLSNEHIENIYNFEYQGRRITVGDIIQAKLVKNDNYFNLSLRDL
jgi:cellulose biosynthesis protein BcsQ